MEVLQGVQGLRAGEGQAGVAKEHGEVPTRLGETSGIEEHKAQKHCKEDVEAAQGLGQDFLEDDPMP